MWKSSHIHIVLDCFPGLNNFCLTCVAGVHDIKMPHFINPREPSALVHRFNTWHHRWVSLPFLIDSVLCDFPSLDLTSLFPREPSACVHSCVSLYTLPFGLWQSTFRHMYLSIVPLCAWLTPCCLGGGCVWWVLLVSNCVRQCFSELINLRSLDRYPFSYLVSFFFWLIWNFFTPRHNCTNWTVFPDWIFVHMNDKKAPELLFTLVIFNVLPSIGCLKTTLLPSSIPVIWSYRTKLHHNKKRSRSNNVSSTLTPLARDVTYSLCCETHTPLRHNFALLNTHSLANKGTLLNDIIAERKLDILLLTETLQLPNDFMELNLLTPPGYCHLPKPRLTGRGCGLAAVIKKKKRCHMTCSWT